MGSVPRPQGRVIVTWSNVAVASIVLEWLDTARPTHAFAGRVIVSVATSTHVVPSDDWYADNVAPLRVTLTQYGAVTINPAVLVVVPPATRRRWKLFPFAGVTIIVAWADPAVRSPRIITPALTHAFVDWTEATRATMVPSPASG